MDHKRLRDHLPFPKMTSPAENADANGVDNHHNEISSEQVYDKAATTASDLVIDLNQTWQRSLLRELDHLSETKEDECNHESGFPPDRLLLGRAHSGDFALPFEDDYTIDTDASSTVPTRAQNIHRMSLHATRNESLFYDEDEDDATNERDVAGDPRSLQEERDALATGVLNELREEQEIESCRNQDGLDLHESKNRLRHWQEQGAKTLHRAGGFDPEFRSPPWGDYQGEEQANCMCWGYTVLDFLLEPTVPNGGPYRKRKSRRSMVSRHPPLTIVTEELRRVSTLDIPEHQY